MPRCHNAGHVVWTVFQHDRLLTRCQTGEPLFDIHVVAIGIVQPHNSEAGPARATADPRQLVLQDNEACLPQLLQKLLHALPITEAPVFMIPRDVDDRNTRRLTELLRPRQNDRNTGTPVGDVSSNDNEVRTLRTDGIDCTPRGRRRIAQMGVAQLHDSSSVPLFGQPGNRYLDTAYAVSYTHLRAHETRHDLVCRLL